MPILRFRTGDLVMLRRGMREEGDLQPLSVLAEGAGTVTLSSGAVCDDLTGRVLCELDGTTPARYAAIHTLGYKAQASNPAGAASHA